MLGDDIITKCRGLLGFSKRVRDVYSTCTLTLRVFCLHQSGKVWFVSGSGWSHISEKTRGVWRKKGFDYFWWSYFASLHRLFNRFNGGTGCLSRGPTHDKVPSNVPFGWTKKVIVPFRVPIQFTINVTQLSAAHHIQLLPLFFSSLALKHPESVTGWRNWKVERKDFW